MGILTVEKEQFLMDGKPYRILSGAMHYFRIPQQYWYDRLCKLKACGFNTVETYTCWNLHERTEGKFDFTGMLDICRYIETAQSLGLNVIVRPGPYICAEWEFGGLPAWLLRYRDMDLRCDDPLFLEKVRAYYRELFDRIRPYLCTNGGNIIMMQVENEYGSYGNDKTYLREVEKIYRENEIDCVLFTADGSWHYMLEGGTLPNLLATANFGSRADENFRELRAYRQGEPLMCMEFWSGWFDHWYEEHHTRTAEDIAENVRELLDSGASFNFYMFHGGTNFGFLNGANHTGEQYQPTVTSYDYCAPLTECGDLTQTYHRIRELLGAPEVDESIKNLPKKAYGTIKLTQKAMLLPQKGNLAQPVYAPQPKQMEQLGQNFGFLLYTTTLRGPMQGYEIDLGRVHDRAIVFLNGERIGVWERTRRKDPMTVTLARGETAKLEILVENMGRVNYGTKLLDTKGLLDGVRIANRFHFGWEMHCLPMEDLSGLLWEDSSVISDGQPAFLRGTFSVTGDPADTFLHLPHFHKGFCMINGFNLGRYWNDAGPQKTLYVPAPMLRSGENELIVFETDGCDALEVELIDAPQLG